MPRVILFNKPFRTLSQFRASGDKLTLADFISDPSLRIAGRLDFDSEGLMVLTDSGPLASRITHPRYKLAKTYLAQVEGIPPAAALAELARGVLLNDGPTGPCRARAVPEPDWLWPRDPPIRYRASIPASWLELTITEGRNRQVRRMTAAIGHPTLRLVRIAVGPWQLADLPPGQWTEARLPAALRN